MATLFLAVANTSTIAIAEVCDKGDLLPESTSGFVLAGVLFLGPPGLLLLKKRWGDELGGAAALFWAIGFAVSFLISLFPPDASDPFVEAMKHEGCQQYGFVTSVALALLTVGYASLYRVAYKRLRQLHRTAVAN